MNRIALSVAALLMGVGLVAANAVAGYHVAATPAVTFQRDASVNTRVTVKGSMGAAHNTNNPNIFMQCRIRGYGDVDAGNAHYEGECRANDGTFNLNQEPYCWVDDNDMNLLQAIVSVNGSSYVEFKYDDGPGDNKNRCSEITVENNSKYLAKNADVLNVFKHEVDVDLGTGSLGDARNSSDTAQEIGCNIYADGSFKQGYCHATDKNGNTTSCSTTVKNTLFTMSAIKSDSYIEFPPDGECGGRLEVMNSSKWRPAY